MAETLTTVLSTAEHTAMTAEASFAALTAKTLTRLKTPWYFISLRSVGSVLTDAEYTAFSAFLTQVSQAGERQAAMVALLARPCNTDGDTGGLDITNAEVLAMVAQFGQVEGMADAAAKITALGYEACSWADVNYPGLRLIHVIRVKRSISQ